jgi:hypothetical protein
MNQSAGHGPAGDEMVQDAKRWRFLLAGEVEVTFLYDEQENMIGMLFESDYEICECYSPAEVNAAIDRSMALAHFSARLH